MLFSQPSHQHYTHSPLAEVVCQLRFPTILSIDAQPPAAYQETIRQSFPNYQLRRELLPPRITGLGTPNPKVEQQPSIANYCFLSADGLWQLNLTQDFISLSTRAYPGWHDFAARLDQPLASFIKLYQPSFFQRIGLRYVNAVSRKALDLTGTPWRELIAPAYLGVLQEEDLAESALSRGTVDTEFTLNSSCRAKIHAGPGLLKRPVPGAAPDPESRFILDMDLSMGGNVNPALAAPGLETLHDFAQRLFQGAITDQLHQAML